jgi:hypothetical protein
MLFFAMMSFCRANELLRRETTGARDANFFILNSVGISNGVFGMLATGISIIPSLSIAFR